VLGLFPLGRWRALLSGAGFEVHEEAYVEGPDRYAQFVCVR
jgi:hypothetical protein